METKNTLCGWGRLHSPGQEICSENLERITRDVPLSRGLARSYGDSSLPPSDRPLVAGTRLADRILAFDPQTGILKAESGFSLFELNRLFLPRGWSSPVLPGTQFVTLGGMVAADVHGKNHHIDGTFGRHVRSLRMQLADGRRVMCSRDSEADLFRATLGGMGLTGHILEVECHLQAIPSPWIYCSSERIAGLDPFLAALSASAESWPFTVGWIDSLSRGRAMGRGILLRGRWATKSEAPELAPSPKRRFGVPFDFPSWVLNPLTVRAFNFAYYWKHWRREQTGIVHPESFFHPLDAIHDWNRIYGQRGFTQYQCVIPKGQGASGVRKFFDLLTRLGGASFLSVIKDCGEEGEGVLSFPCAGTTIAVDLAISSKTQTIVDRLNELLIEQGGRVYLAKDALTRRDHFRAMETRLGEWQALRKRYDPEARLGSAQSARLFGGSA